MEERCKHNMVVGTCALCKKDEPQNDEPKPRGGNMNGDFRESVQALSDDGLAMLKDYFKGAPITAPKVNAALRVLGFGVKIEHMNQLKDHGDKSLALRVMQFLPKTGKAREEYLKATNPDVIGPLLLSRPKKASGGK